uniref:HEAT repeat domain-containing protein n=1 Tax=Alexandrium andersonii TaxID=327968 RepID=A0A7S2CMZ0_9DINO
MAQLLLPDPEIRLAAMEALAWIADDWPHDGALLALMGQLENHNPLTRQSAVRALSRLMEGCSEHAVEAVGRLMAHPMQGVRQSATQLLMHVKKGNSQAIASLASCLEHSDWQVRRDAMRTLVQVVDKGDAFAVAAVQSRLKHPEAHVRCAAEEALKWVQTGGEGMCWL